jgi:transcriptional regulator with XRE-family HTH domain
MAWSTSIFPDTLPSMAELRFKRVTRTLSKALRARRRQLRLTQEDVAERLGMITRQYQKIESGEVNVTLRTLVRLCDALSVELRELF